MRLFLALWPGEGARDALATVGLRLADAGSGKAVPPEKIHLTLAFLGEVATERVDAVRAVAAATLGEPFQLTLDSVGWFRNARVAWAGSSRPPEALSRLQSGLAGGLGAAGFELDGRPFAVHVTLARKIARPVAAAAMAPIAWRASEFVLARSETGTGRYSILERWSLERD